MISQNEFPPNIGCLKYVHELLNYYTLNGTEGPMYSKFCLYDTLLSCRFVLMSCFSTESIEIHTSAFDTADLPEKVNKVSAPRTPVR